MKTIKQVERQESSEEEELSTSAQDEQESDSEDYPPGAPEVMIIKHIGFRMKRGRLSCVLDG